MFHKKTEMSMPIIFILLGIAAFAYSMTIPKDDGMFLKIIALIMIVTSAAILYFILRYLNYKKWVVILGFALFVTLLTYGVFNGLLSVPLPTPFFMD